jgi:predicted RNase H-like HicB family nuclease
MKYEIKISKTGNGYSAFVPDLPGCVAAAETFEETQQLIEQAIAFHREGLALERSLLVSLIFSVTQTNVPIWDATNALSMFIDLEAPPLSITALSRPKHFGTLSATA